MNPLRIEQMTVFDLEPAAVIGLAEDMGIPLISLWAAPGIEGARPVTAANKREVIARLKNSPVTVDTVEIFMLSPHPADQEGGIAIAAELGATAIVAINLTEPDEERAAQQFADLCAIAARYDLLVSLEPIYMGVTRTIAEGLRLIRKSGAANARLTVDLLHVFRTGTLMADIARLDPALIGSAQICDGPLTVKEEDILEEGAFTRMVPGTGSFPVEAFLRALPDTVPLGVEVPLRALREGGMSARDRTHMVVEATRALQKKVAV